MNQNSTIVRGKARNFDEHGNCRDCAFSRKRIRPFAHCPECHQTWTSRREAHCTQCHHHFGGVSTFDRHQNDAGITHCVEPEDVGLKWNADRDLWIRPLPEGAQFNDGVS